MVETVDQRFNLKDKIVVLSRGDQRVNCVKFQFMVKKSVIKSPVSLKSTVQLLSRYRDYAFDHFKFFKAYGF